ncbi:MAG: menaquinone biosynthetic enzyme MqnA/MqnD family protein [Acidobacteriota bacterium]
MGHLRLASVPFVNAEPLIWGFTRGPYRGVFDVIRVAPPRIPELLRAGEVEVGLIPSIEYQRLGDARILPYLCVASKRRARSVYLASRVPLRRVRRIAVDENSRTSVALLKMILAHRGIREVETIPRAPSLREMLRDSDAALLIGDAALTTDTRGLEVRDLAAEWFAITGLPFVFALWAVRPDAVLPDGARPFLESRKMGIANIPAIAREAAPRLRLKPATIEDYLRIDIHYHLASEESRALDLFFRQARELGLVPGRRAIVVHEPSGWEAARAGRGG